ncbi:DUF1376 domain-containing protein [Xanthomonas sp. CFBP 7698]|uniref:DUF1376 domain-containing protein n=1 Tax=Xanthomonas sp. CFBP 7698 TaxID=2082399 RepID=UPI000ECBCB38|nr:DUF1376 domain-containing protein [Xanthomonas sp. CFBP 7698]RJS04889.1 hypothetical protein XnspCFBP7698_01095 [Xanthomonas sp. CFBP 7698]
MTAREPMVPADVDLRGMPYMPLDVNRLRDSGMAIKASGDEFRAAILLWCACWHEVPAASLPDDDEILASYAGYARNLRAWKRLKVGAMRGFVLCKDGRYYHPLIADKAAQAWTERLEFQGMRENDRLRKERERQDRVDIFGKLRAYGVVLPYNTPTGKLREHLADLEAPADGHGKVTVTGHAQVTANKGKGSEREREGRGKGALKASSPNNASAEKPLEDAADLARVLRDMGWSECADGHPDLMQAKAEGITANDIRAAAAGKSGKPIRYVVNRARGMRDDAAESAGQPGNVVHIKTAEQQQADEAKQLRRALDDKILQVQNDHRLELIDDVTRDQRVADIREAIADLDAMVSTAKEARS